LLEWAQEKVQGAIPTSTAARTRGIMIGLMQRVKITQTGEIGTIVRIEGQDRMDAGRQVRECMYGVETADVNHFMRYTEAELSIIIP
jgi:hypothetical protein